MTTVVSVTHSRLQLMALALVLPSTFLWILLTLVKTVPIHSLAPTPILTLVSVLELSALTAALPSLAPKILSATLRSINQALIIIVASYLAVIIQETTERTS